MQVFDEAKREKILAAATALFATRPFHKVLLSDVAAAATVGKGTLYTYFSSKEDLYLTVVYLGFEQLLERLKQRLEVDDPADLPPGKSLEIVIREFVGFAFQNPHLFELMRSVPDQSIERSRWEEKRIEFTHLIKSIILRGCSSGEFADPHPEFTSLFIPGLVRSALLHGTDGRDKEDLTEHILRFVKASLVPRTEP